MKFFLKRRKICLLRISGYDKMFTHLLSRVRRRRMFFFHHGFHRGNLPGPPGSPLILGKERLC
jgi:hypothetical protein